MNEDEYFVQFQINLGRAMDRLIIRILEQPCVIDDEELVSLEAQWLIPTKTPPM